MRHYNVSHLRIVLYFSIFFQLCLQISQQLLRHYSKHKHGLVDHTDITTGVLLKIHLCICAYTNHKEHFIHKIHMETGKKTSRILADSGIASINYTRNRIAYCTYTLLLEGDLFQTINPMRVLYFSQIHSQPTIS